MTKDLALCWDLPETVESNTPRAPIREVRILELEGRTCVILHDLARCLNLDRKRLVKSLHGRARLIDAIDVDGAERILIVVPSEDFFAMIRGSQSGRSGPN